MKNKNKGELTSENVVSIVISLIVILFLIALASGLFGLFTSKNEREQAKATLDRIVRKAELMEEGQESSVLVTAPKDWYLVNYDYSKAKNYDGVPKQCNGEDCLCICKANLEGFLNSLERKTIFETGIYVNYFYYRNENAYEGLSDCENEGVCMKLDNKFKINQFIVNREVEGIIEFKKIESLNWISLDELPLSLYLERKTNNIVVEKDKLTIPDMETPNIDELLNQKVDLSEGEGGIDCEHLLKSSINFCHFSGGKISLDEGKAEKCIEEFLESNDGGIKFYYIETHTQEKKEKEVIFKEGEDEEVKEIKKLCDEDFVTFIEYYNKK